MKLSVTSAARNFSDYTDDEIAGKGGRDNFRFNDADGDGQIDLTEFNFGNSVNAAKRDRKGSGSDFTADDRSMASWPRSDCSQPRPQLRRAGR